MGERKEMTEREAWAHLLHGLGICSNAARGLMLLRRDQNLAWGAIVHLFDTIKDNAERLMHSTKGRITGKSPGLVLPPRH